MLRSHLLKRAALKDCYLSNYWGFQSGWMALEKQDRRFTVSLNPYPLTAKAPLISYQRALGKSYILAAEIQEDLQGNKGALTSLRTDCHKRYQLM